MSDAVLSVDLVVNFKKLKKQAREESLGVDVGGKDSASKESNGGFINTIKGLTKTMKAVLGVLSAGLIPVMTGFVKVFQPLFDVLENIGTILGAFFVPLIRLLLPTLVLLTRFLVFVLQGYNNLVSDFTEGLKSLVNKAGEFFVRLGSDVLGYIKSAFGNIGSRIVEAVKGVFKIGSGTGFISGAANLLGFGNNSGGGFGSEGFSRVPNTPDFSGFNIGGIGTGVNINVAGLTNDDTANAIFNKLRQLRE